MKVTCIVDNHVLHGALWGEHGFACLVESGGRRLLFDTGGGREVLQHNLAALKVDAGGLDGIALSHGHLDHTGGLLPLAPSLRRVPLWAHPEAFGPKLNSRTGEAIGIGDRRSDLEPYLDLRLSEEAAETLPGVWTTGEIRERPYFEGRGAGHSIRGGDDCLPDPCHDDLSLVLQAPDGLVLLCGCAHAGLLNILEQVRGRYRAPLLAVVGGTHLGGLTEAQLGQVSDYLRAAGSPLLYLSHCTGFRATAHMARAFPEHIRPFGAGAGIEWPVTALV